MPEVTFAAIFSELRQTLDEQRQNAEAARSEITEIRARSGDAILQSRALIASVDALLKPSL